MTRVEVIKEALVSWLTEQRRVFLHQEGDCATIDGLVNLVALSEAIDAKLEEWETQSQ